MDSISLQERICNLPQELYDLILNFVLEVDTDQTITIDHNYRPPVQLQIDYRSRKIAADVYYSGNIFIIAETVKEPRDSILCKWLTSLSERHVEKKKEIRVPFYDIEEAVALKREGHDDPSKLSRIGLLLRLTLQLRCLEFEAPFHCVQKRWAKYVVLKTDWKDSGRRETKWFNREELENLKISPYERLNG